MTALDSRPSEWILREISFHAAPGSMTAVVGPTGGGKTTLCYLVPRLYDVTRGSVSIDGLDVREQKGDRLTLVSTGDLPPLLDWLGRQPLADLRLEPLGLKATYHRYHGPEAEEG